MQYAGIVQVQQYRFWIVTILQKLMQATTGQLLNCTRSTQKAVHLSEYGGKPVYKDCPIPSPASGELLVKVEGAGIHSCDHGRIAGTYRPVELPTVLGLEGTGRVIEANGEHLQHWVGKRICYYFKPGGSWAEFATVDADVCYMIDDDVPLELAVSGVGNPITVVGMTDVYSAVANHRGIVSTGASSMTGRLLSKRCQKLGIPILNLVRREEQAEVLKGEGAEHVIVTKDNWEDSLKAAIRSYGFNVYFDGLGGGPITETIVKDLPPNSTIFVYGELASQPLSLSNPSFTLAKGKWVSSYLMADWWENADPERKQEIRREFSSLIKDYMHTKVCHVRKMSQIEEALELSKQCASEGRVMLLPG